MNFYSSHRSVQSQTLYISVVGIGALLLGADAFVMGLLSLLAHTSTFLLLVNYSRHVVASSRRCSGKGFSKSERGSVFSIRDFSMSTTGWAVVLSKMAEEESVGISGSFRLFESLNFPIS